MALRVGAGGARPTRPLGLRRGEACGLRCADTDLGTGTTTIRWQITQLGWATHHGAPSRRPARGRSLSILRQSQCCALTAICRCTRRLGTLVPRVVPRAKVEEQDGL
jgi:integrase